MKESERINRKRHAKKNKKNISMKKEKRRELNKREKWKKMGIDERKQK